MRVSRADKEKWDASVARHKKYDMQQIFAQFDVDAKWQTDACVPDNNRTQKISNKTDDLIKAVRQKDWDRMNQIDVKV